MSDEIKERESALEQQYNELLDESKRKVQAHEVTIQRLTSTLADKDQQLQVRPQKHKLQCLCSKKNFLWVLNFFTCVFFHSGVHEHGEGL